MTRIRISWPQGEAFGALNDTATAEALANILPITGAARTWGDEVYFDVSIETAPAEEATDVVDPGTICYWLEGAALALPFGRTPASRGDECRLASAVNILGKLEGDPRALATVNPGDVVTVTHA